MYVFISILIVSNNQRIWMFKWSCCVSCILLAILGRTRVGRAQGGHCWTASCLGSNPNEELDLFPTT